MPLGHVIGPHASVGVAAVHSTLHLHALEHVVRLHAPVAVHWMSQLPLSPPPHVMLLHALPAVHWTLQLWPLHVMSSHAPSALHRIWHSEPD
jgi:hypothetical protein